MKNEWEGAGKVAIVCDNNCLTFLGGDGDGRRNKGGD